MKQNLTIKNLHISCQNTPIVKGVSFTLARGDTHILMGPNGSGKSTLLASLMGLPHTQIMKGDIFLGRTNITSYTPEERAKKRLFLGFQHPPEVPGVSIAMMLRHAMGQGQDKKKKIDIALFAKRLKEESEKLGLETGFTSRTLNQGFSGGERKKSEILQVLIAEPRFVFLDEIDSGLDIDSLRLCLAALRILQLRTGTSFLFVTHNPSLLAYVFPTRVHIMIDGRIVRSGEKELMKTIADRGFEQFLNH